MTRSFIILAILLTATSCRSKKQSVTSSTDSTAVCVSERLESSIAISHYEAALTDVELQVPMTVSLGQGQDSTLIVKARAARVDLKADTSVAAVATDSDSVAVNTVTRTATAPAHPPDSYKARLLRLILIVAFFLIIAKYCTK